MQLIQSSDSTSAAEPPPTAHLSIDVGTDSGQGVRQPVTVALEQSVSMYSVYRGYLVHEDALWVI